MISKHCLSLSVWDLFTYVFVSHQVRHGEQEGGETGRGGLKGKGKNVREKRRRKAREHKREGMIERHKK